MTRVGQPSCPEDIPPVAQFILKNAQPLQVSRGKIYKEQKTMFSPDTDPPGVILSEADQREAESKPVGREEVYRRADLGRLHSFSPGVQM